ncbi:outer membrane protein assembly factor BamE domain-containing protein [Azohydromonas caseinilytica]|uniref:Outer membrane protein assembly factor BamE n=1 Tax=Azohydromonas caseinilytica TaxID=2728836 RepID=A0A848FL62_9BURK|nr:outer membrane protein assembly factor BamE [Azohydromonas caseinilytica]NML18541.1 outer membrane protein assembly factor BamE [Azohydromonas caseinilytica]
MAIRTTAAALLVAALPLAATAQSLPDPGYLCCNMRTSGNWISDINYASSGTRVIPAGTPVTPTGFGRYRVHVTIEGTPQDIGNDYSRELDMGVFARRYVVPDNPAAAIAKMPRKVRQAIQSARVMPGMTREQVLMAVGYPITSENPNLNARVWRYWLSRTQEFQVVFDARNRVGEVIADPQTRALAVMN